MGNLVQWKCRELMKHSFSEIPIQASFSIGQWKVHEERMNNCISTEELKGIEAATVNKTIYNDFLYLI